MDGRRIAVFFFLLMCCCRQTASAEVVTDGTMGPVVALQGPEYRIGAELATLHGGNLFHSFQTFTVETGTTALFTGPAEVVNIINRVTGGELSWIDGSLRSGISGANLFLINPAGVVFGANASLDVSGDFHVSTADYLRLDDGSFFAADAGSGSSLSSAPPAAFGFLGTSPQPIYSGAWLVGSEGNSITVVGGEIALIGGGMSVRKGTIGLVSVAGPGEIALAPEEVDGTAAGGAISMSYGALLEANDGRIVLRGDSLAMEYAAINTASSADAVAGGLIDIALAGELLLTDSAWISGATFDASPGADITLKARRIFMEAGASIDTSVRGGGNGGLLDIVSDESLEMIGGSSIDTSVWNTGTGDGGDLKLVTGQLTLSGPGGISTETAGSGSGGSVTLEVENLLVDSGAHITAGSYGVGLGSDLTICATDEIRLSGNRLLTEEDGTSWTASSTIVSYVSDELNLNNSMELSAARVEVRDGAWVGAIAQGAGEGADVIIRASEGLYVGGTANGANASISSLTMGSGAAGDIFIDAPLVSIYDAGIINTTSAGEGNGGLLDIHAGRIDLARGGSLDSSALGSGNGGHIALLATESLTVNGLQEVFGKRSGISALTSGSGAAGLVEIVAQAVAITDQGEIVVGTLGTGPAGDISIAAEEVTVSRDGRINADTFTEGQGGDITLNVERLLVTEGGSISASVVDNSDAGEYNSPNGLDGTGTGGNILVAASEYVQLLGASSERYSEIRSYTGGSGPGGTITVVAPEVVIDESAWIHAVSLTKGGNAGSIRIVADRLLLANEGQVNVLTAGDGHGGAIEIDAAHLLMQKNAAIKAESKGSGQGGTIDLRAGTLRMDDSEITTKTILSDGGNVRLIVADMIDLRDSRLITSVQGGAGSGGNITIGGTPAFVILDGGEINANAYEGAGGNISIVADSYLADVESLVTASSTLGIDGHIDISAPQIDVGGILAVPAPHFQETVSLSRDRCEQRGRREASSLLGSP